MSVNHTRIELSAGGIIARQLERDVEILVIQDGYGNWGFPKGHIEPGEEAVDAALRECREETGLMRLEALAPLGATDWYFRAGDVIVHKYCDYFLMKAEPDDQASPQGSEGIQLVEWVGTSDAVARVTYSNARHMLEAALEHLRGAGGA